MLLVLTLVAVLAWLNLADPSAKSRLSEQAQRKFEDTLRETARGAEEAVENGLDTVESKVLDSINGIITPSPKDRQNLDDPSGLPNGSGEDSAKGLEQPPLPAQNAPFPQSSSDSSYGPHPQVPPYPTNDPGRTGFLGGYAPYFSHATPQGSYQQPGQEAEKQVDKSLKNLERMFGQ